jgi:hypothetical protein
MDILLELIDRERKVNAPTVLQVQREMVEEKRTLDETSVGQQFEAELVKQRERHAREIKQMQEDIKQMLEANEKKMAEEIEKDKRDLEERIHRANMDQAMLKKSLQDMQRQQEDEIARLKAQVEEERLAYEETIRRLQEGQMQLEHLDPASSAAEALQAQIVLDVTDAEEMEQDIAAKNKTITRRLKRKC